MLSRWFVLLLLVLVPMCALANIPAKPADCPTVAALYAEGFDKVRPNPVPNGYMYDFIKQKSRYDTPGEWTFILTMASFAPDEETAKKAAREKIKQLTLHGPDWAMELQAWQCWSYQILPGGELITAMVFTPPRAI